MHRYFKLTAALAAFALLVVVMGLGAQNTVQAQAPATTASTTVGAPSESYICSNNQGGCKVYARTATTAADPEEPTTGAPANDDTAVGDNLFLITGDASAAIKVTIKNVDLPTVTQKVRISASAAETTTVDGPDANPKTIHLPAGTNAIIEAVHKSSGLVDGRCDINGAPAADDNDNNDKAYDTTECGTAEVSTVHSYQVKAFNGNKIQVSYTSTDGTFAVIKNVTVDNGKPSLVSTSPAPGLIVKGNTDITFSADITDSTSGFAGKFTGAAGLTNALSPDGLLNDGTGTFQATDKNDVTLEGGVRLVVAGNVVDLKEGNFTKIDGGWRVSAKLNSTALQAISTNVPWYFEVRDRANNLQRTSGSVSGSAGSTSAGGTVVDARFIGSLNVNTFLGSIIRVSRKVGSDTVTGNNQTTAFAGATGQFTPVNTATDPLFKDAVPSRMYDSNGDGTLDSTDTVIPATEGFQCPFDARDTIVLTPATPTSGTNQTVATTTVGEADGTAADQATACAPKPKDGYEILGTNLITIDSVPPTLASGSPVQTGLGYNAVKKQDKAQKNSIKVSFTDKGKASGAGSTAPGSGIDAATVTASAFSVSGHTVQSAIPVGNSVYLTLSDNLGSTERPWLDIAGSQIRDKAGNAVTAARDRAVDKLGPNLTLSKSADLSNDKVTITVTSDEQLNASPTIYVTEAKLDGTAEIGDSGVSPVRQTGAMTYSYAHEDSTGGEFSVYVTASDVGETSSMIGDNDSAADPGSFTFELDKQLNNNTLPAVSVGDTPAGAGKKVEQVDPLIVTVDFKEEGKEYSRDSYRTVELTSAKLSIRLPDGTTENRTLDLATDVTTPDKVKYTFPLLNPKIGDYTLTVQAKDSAGNTQVSGSANMTGKWSVIAPKPVSIALAPGWNLISLPFQPANPAINSVVPADHPADIVMTFDNANQIWLVSRRDSDSGLFSGDIAVMTANTAYFVRTENFQPLRLLRPALATAAAAPPPPPAISVVEGWNLVPVVTNTPGQTKIAADDYFGTLKAGVGAGWLKALTFDTLSRTWDSVTPGETSLLTFGAVNPCTGRALSTDADETANTKVQSQAEPCQAGKHSDVLTAAEIVARRTGTGTSDDPYVNPTTDLTAFDAGDTVAIRTPVTVGKGYWLYATVDGVIIP